MDQMKALTGAEMKALPSERQLATIYDVAERAAVSIATVSRVLRGSAPVAEGTRSRVMEAVETLGFRPSRLGQSLAEGRHAANGIVFPDLSGPYYAEVVLGYEEVAAELGRSVLILTTHGRAAARDLVFDLAARVDGLAIFARTVPDDVVWAIAATGLPVVLVARPPIGDLDTVRAENTRHARALTRHLIGHGYRSMVFLGDAESSPDTFERWQGVRAALRTARLPVPDEPVRCHFDEQAGHDAAAAVLARAPLPDALICANDEIALGAILAAEELGLGVPRDVAITGWDDVMAARYSRPGLTSVRQPMRALGATAARLLAARIGGDRQPPVRDVLPAQLVVRASCGDHEQQHQAPPVRRGSTARRPAKPTTRRGTT